MSYDKSFSGHPNDKEVQLRLIANATGSTKVLTTTIHGGQGTINVASCHPAVFASLLCAIGRLLNESRSSETRIDDSVYSGHRNPFGAASFL